MRLWPTRRLVALAGGGTGASALLVLAPALWPLAMGALALLALATLWDALALRAAPPLALARTKPERAFVGRAAKLALCVRAAARARVELLEEIARDLAPEDPSWPALALAAGETRALEYEVRPTRRGDRPFGRAIAFELGPFGLLRRRSFGAAGETLRVYPDTTRSLSGDALDARRLALAGVRPARKRGDGMEFESLRDYAPGDDPRRLDWAASARRGRPVVRQHQHERNHVVLLALDTSRLMGARAGGRTKLDWAIDALLALAHASQAAGDRVGLAIFDRDLRAHVSPRARRHGIGAFAEALRNVEPQLVEADHLRFAQRLVALQRQRALVVVLTDFVEAEAGRLIDPFAVLGKRHRVLVVALRDPVFAALDPRAEAPPAQLYRRLVLDDLLHEREAALLRLQRAGVETLDLPPERVSAPLLNRFLALRFSAEL
ncbi:MAG TPA: DUF58 domain-containing protein [Myxococcota bacterium]